MESTTKVQHAVAHIDILGFKELIENADRTNTVYQFGEAIDTAIQQVRHISPDAKFKTFSDNICCSLPLTDEPKSSNNLFNFILILAAIQNEMTIGFGHFVRGGASIGVHYQSEHTVVSKPFTEAYLLESKSAIVPRIILDSKLVEKLGIIEGENTLYSMQAFIKLLLIRDNSETTPSINYLSIIIFKYLLKWRDISYMEKELSDVLERHRNLITTAMAQSNKQDVISKMRWSANYHNWFISNLKNYMMQIFHTFVPGTFDNVFMRNFESIIHSINGHDLFINNYGISIFR